MGVLSAPRVSTSPHHAAIMGCDAMGNAVGVKVPTAPLKVMFPLLFTNIAVWLVPKKFTPPLPNAAAMGIDALEPSSFAASTPAP